MEMTDRFALPLLAAGQAGKEMTHNEALVLLDIALHPTVEAIAGTPPEEAERQPGRNWLVAPDAAGDWAGKDDAIASWTPGGWRFLAPVAGMSVAIGTARALARFDGAGWQQAAPAASPSGGTTVDEQARAAIDAILASLRRFGLTT